MKLVLVLLTITLGLLVPAYAALPLHARVPDFTAQASQAGKPFTFSLSKALRLGPVVLYFFPKAFTRGCTYESQEFAKTVDQFTALGATVVGVSNDEIGTQNKFSVDVCAGKFAVVSDPSSQIIKLFRVNLWGTTGNADRVSYVIAPDGKVVFVYADTNPDKHVELTLEALRKWKDGK